MRKTHGKLGYLIDNIGQKGKLNNVYIKNSNFQGLEINISIPNEDYNIYNINELVSYYSIKYNNINIYLKDHYFKHDGEKKGFSITVPGNTNVSIIGNPNNGTIIDFSKNIFYYSILFNEYTGQHVKFENITFFNFINRYSTTENDLIYVPIMDNNFNIVLKNCTFDTINTLVLLVMIRVSFKKKSSNYQIIIDSCKFR
ncbi:hypothetical protein PIROE2DRAFT_16351 [Piromyces sp. E2]|nr:hypothetical protein PIROE2DRAFT_16351 [Piromyces sp. E2]|eukprot:OUM58387.1 hypothetical protein PIROE2DRAFT_16351 [Piromyces sp. E2]